MKLILTALLLSLTLLALLIVLNRAESYPEVWTFNCKEANDTLVCRTDTKDLLNIHCPQGITITAKVSNVPEDKRDEIPDLLCSQVILTIQDRIKAPL